MDIDCLSYFLTSIQEHLQTTTSAVHRAFIKAECDDSFQTCSSEHLQTFRNQTIVIRTKLKFDPISKLYRKGKIDCHGASIYTTGLPFGQEHISSNCVSGKCHYVGHFFDVMKVLQDMFNFTLNVHQGKVFGSVPVEGAWDDLNATFQGVLQGSDNI